MLITTTYALTTKILNSLTFNYWFMHTTQCISYVMYSTLVTWLASKILNKWNPYITRKARNVKHDHSGETNILQSNNTCHPQFWPRREWDPCGCNMVVEFEISGLHSESWRFVVEKGLLPQVWIIKNWLESLEGIRRYLGMFTSMNAAGNPCRIEPCKRPWKT